MVDPRRLPMRAGQAAQLRELGYDEIWLQNWLVADPARLGLGQVHVVAQELTAPRGGSLDILAADGDTYYSIEVQLGEVDAWWQARPARKQTGKLPSAPKPGLSMTHSSPGRRRTSARSASTTALSHMWASAAAAAWAPLWFRKDGASIYLPDPDGLRGEQQSPAMDVFQEKLREEDIETTWRPTYNAGANPVPIRLRQEDLAKPVVQDLLRATFEILDQGAIPWSERQSAINARLGGERRI